MITAKKLEAYPNPIDLYQEEESGVLTSEYELERDHGYKVVDYTGFYIIHSYFLQISHHVLRIFRFVLQEKLEEYVHANYNLENYLGKENGPCLILFVEKGC